MDKLTPKQDFYIQLELFYTQLKKFTPTTCLGVGDKYEVHVSNKSSNLVGDFVPFLCHHLHHNQVWPQDDLLGLLFGICHLWIHHLSFLFYAGLFCLIW